MQEATTLEAGPSIHWVEAIHAQFSRVIVGGQHLLFRGRMQALLAVNHVLIEALPGMGKTLSVLTIAGSLDATIDLRERIQKLEDKRSKFVDPAAQR